MQRDSIIALFASSFIFLVFSYFSALLPNIFLDLILLPIFILGTAAFFKKSGQIPALVFAISGIVYFFLTGLEYISTLYLHLSLISFALFFLWPNRTKLLSGCGSIPRRIGYGILLFILMIATTMLVNIVLHVAGVTDQAKVAGIISNLPLYLLILAFTLGPIGEELFFRALLVPRVGIIISALMFGFMHFAYGSIAEFSGTLFLGLVLGTAYHVLKDPLPCIVAHALFNLLSIMVILWVY